MIEADAGCQAVAQITLMDHPGRIARPGDLALPAQGVAVERSRDVAFDGGFDARHICVNAKTTWPRAGMVLLPHMRKIDVTDLVSVIERHEKSPVPNRNVAWQATSFNETNRRTDTPVDLIGINRSGS